MKKHCQSTTQSGHQCSKFSLPFSRYCWLHQDLPSKVGLSLTVLAILLAFGIFLYQERSPSLSAECQTNEGENPCEIICKVKNSGRGVSRDALLSFNKLLPVDTKVFASPELGIVLQESESILNPTLYPSLAEITKAFAVRIPTIAAGDTVSFRVLTINKDNQRACQQIITIRQQIIDILSDFGERLKNAYPKIAANWDVQSVINAKVKQENLYTPDIISYEKGRDKINYLAEKETFALSLNGDLYKRFKKEFIDIYQNRPSFLAPVIRIKTSSGAVDAYVIYPSYIRTCANFTLPIYQLKELKEKGSGEAKMNATIPKSYEGECSKSNDG